MFRALNRRENPGPCTVFPCHYRAGPGQSLRRLLMGCSIASSFLFPCPHQPLYAFPVAGRNGKAKTISRYANDPSSLSSGALHMAPSNAGFRSLHLLPILTCYRIRVKREVPCGASIFRWITIMKLPVRLALLLPEPCFRLWLCNYFSTLLARPVFNMGILSLSFIQKKKGLL